MTKKHHFFLTTAFPNKKSHFFLPQNEASIIKQKKNKYGLIREQDEMVLQFYYFLHSAQSRNCCNSRIVWHVCDSCKFKEKKTKKHYLIIHSTHPSESVIVHVMKKASHGFKHKTLRCKRSFLKMPYNHQTGSCMMRMVQSNFVSLPVKSAQEKRCSCLLLE